MIAVFPLKSFPNPLKKTDNDTLLIEWFKPHVDQQLIFVKLRKSHIPKQGYFFVYEYGDIDQIYKKRDFISFSVNHPFLKDFFGNYNSINLEKNVIERNDLVSNILKEKGIFTVQGPPGTGKTYLAVETIVQLLKNNSNATILVSSKEHQALNHLMDKTIEALEKYHLSHNILRSISTERLKSVNENSLVKRYSPQVKSGEIGSLVWSSQSKKWEDLQKSKLHEFDLRNRSFSESIATIIFATTMDNIHKRFIGRQSFDLVIIEEAGKCYPSELVHIINLGQYVLLIGDQKQLPPYQIKETIENIHKMEKIFLKAIQDSDLKKDLITRLGKTYEDLLEFYQLHGTLKDEQYLWLKPFEHLFNILPENKKFILQDQYRMEKKLSSIISNVFYDMSFNNKKGIYLPLDGVLESSFDEELVWIDTPHITELPDAGEDPEGTGERINNYELRIIIKFLNLLQIKEKIDLIILTPYNDQKDYFLESDALKDIVSIISKFSFDDTVKTVDEYQGQEADLTIISLVRNNTLGITSSWGFLTEPERLNVMFSRSKSRQVIVGCSVHIERNESHEKMNFLTNFLKEYKEKGIFVNSEEFLNN